MEDSSNFKIQDAQEMNIVKNLKSNLDSFAVLLVVWVFFSKRRKTVIAANPSPANTGLNFSPLHASYS